MAVGPIALQLYRHLFENSILYPGQTMLELGDQNLLTRRSEHIVDSLFELVGKKRATGHQKAWELMCALGFEYAALDLHAESKYCIAADLNDPDLKIDRPFDVVTNHGTTEHIFDQAACFRAVHRLTAPDGVMIHCVPRQGYPNHGFYLYEPGLFKDLADANGYGIVGMWTARDDYKMRAMEEPATLNLLEFKYAAGDYVLLCVVMRKPREDRPFKAPVQGIYQK